MSNKRMEFLIGGMVLTVLITIIVMTILFGAPKKLFNTGGSERMTIVFDKAPGIGNNSRVLKSGVEIGRVLSVDLVDNEDHSEVRVVFRLVPEVRIYTNEYARIQRTVLGDASIEFVKNPNFNGEIKIRDPGEPITGIPGGDLMGTVSNIEGDLAKAIRQVNDAAEEMTNFIAKINILLGSPEDIEVKKSKLDDIISSLGDTLKSTSVLAGNINAIVGNEDVRNSVLSSAKVLPETIKQIQTIVNDAYMLSDDFKYIIQNSGKTVDNVNENLDNLKTFTDSLSKEGPGFVASLTASGEDLRQMVNNINKLAGELNDAIKDPDTPIGMLRDPSVGSSFRSTVQNVEAVTANANEITEGVQQRIYPILDDARIFTNKIAHKPSLLLWGGNTYKGTPTILGNGKYNFQERTPSGGLTSQLYHPSAAAREPRASIFPCLRHSDDAQSDVAPMLIDPNSYEAYAMSNSQEGIAGIEMAGSEMITSGLEEHSGGCLSKPICRLADHGICHMRFSLSKLFCRQSNDEATEYASDYPSSYGYQEYPEYQEYPGVYMDAYAGNEFPVEYEGMAMGQPPMMLDGIDGAEGYAYGQPVIQSPVNQLPVTQSYDGQLYNQSYTQSFDQGGCGPTGCGVQEPPRCEELPGGCAGQEGCAGMMQDGFSYEINGGKQGTPAMENLQPREEAGFTPKDFEGIGLMNGRQVEALPGPLKKVEKGTSKQKTHQTFRAPVSDRPELSTAANQGAAMPSTLPQGLSQTPAQEGNSGFIDDGLPMLYIPNSN